MANLKDAGGTSGGGGSFFLGVALAAAGAYMLTTRVTVTSGGFFSGGGYGGFGHYGFAMMGVSPFGLALIPFMIGFGLLFVNGASKAGWVLTVAGVTIILAGIILNMQIFFRATSLYETLIMLAMLMAGCGLVARSLREFSKYGT